MSVNNGGLAFPWVDSYVNVDKGERYENYGDAGMSLRDYFAAKAMEQLIAKVPYGEYVPERSIALDAYDYADAMLERRK